MALKPIISGSREHMEIARAPLVKQIETLQKELADFHVHHEGIVKELEMKIAVLKDDTSKLKGKLEIAQQQTGNENDLRAQLFSALMDAERMRGYMDAVEDQRPTEMIPAHREKRFGNYNHHSEFVQTYNGQRPRKWFDR